MRDVHTCLVSLAAISSGIYASTGARWYLAHDREIPDYLLPGRAVMRADVEVRRRLERLTVADANAATWWVRKVVEPVRRF